MYVPQNLPTHEHCSCDSAHQGVCPPCLPCSRQMHIEPPPCNSACNSAHLLPLLQDSKQATHGTGWTWCLKLMHSFVSYRSTADGHSQDWPTKVCSRHVCHAPDKCRLRQRLATVPAMLRRSLFSCTAISGIVTCAARFKMLEGTLAFDSRQVRADSLTTAYVLQVCQAVDKCMLRQRRATVPAVIRKLFREPMTVCHCEKARRRRLPHHKSRAAPSLTASCQKCST